MEEAHKATIKAKMPLGHKMIECSLHTQSAFENSLEHMLEVLFRKHADSTDQYASEIIINPPETVSFQRRR